MRIPERTATDLSRMAQWTIECWVNPASFTNVLYPTIYSEGNRLATIGLEYGTGKLDSWVNNDSSKRLIAANALPLNQWSHVALVYDGVNRSLYLNGGLTGTSNAPAITDDSSGAAIGHVTVDDASSPFKGAIDEVSLYNRALTAAEIAAINAAGSAGKCYSTNNPAFVFQPAGQTNYLGATATFTGLAMGSPRPTYQWLLNGGPIIGQTNFTLALPNLTFANDGSYALVASNSAGAITSAVARLTVRFCTDLPAGLVAWWPGDGSGLDVTSNHNGAVWGGVPYPVGRVGKAFGFNGTDAYVAVPDSPALSPHVGTNGEMTVEAWVYLAQLPQTDPYTAWPGRAVLSKGDFGRWEYALYITTAGISTFSIFAPSGATSATISGGQITLTNWHHLIGTFKKGQFVQLYQDGVLMAESTNAIVATADGPSPLYLGRESTGLFLNGRVDEMAIYNRALGENEIATLYAGGAFGKCAGAGNPAPFFAVQPSSQAGYTFLSASLSALALGTPRPDYQWYRSNSPSSWVAVSNATNATLTFTNLSAAVVGFYRATASNVYGAVTSQPALLDVVCHPTVCATNGEDFEMGWNGWTTDNYSVWQVGHPTSGPGGAHSGTNLAATVLDGNYPENPGSGYSTRLSSPQFLVPSAGNLPRLRFWHWHDFNVGPDYGQVQIRVGTGDWQVLSSTYYGYSSGWTRPELDLTPYAGQVVQIGFFFHAQDNSSSSPETAAGWYIDEVAIETGPLPNSFADGREDFEGSLPAESWVSDFGVWEIGVPTSGPGAAHAGSQCLATLLGGNYYEPYGASGLQTSSRIVSRSFTLPPAGNLLQLRFWHWHDFNVGPDYGQVQIRVGTGDWQVLSPTYYGYSSGWTRPELDLTPYAGQVVQIGFFFHAQDNSSSSPETAAGWYIDDIFVKRGNLAIVPIPDQTTAETNCLSFSVNVIGANGDSILSFGLGGGAPAGASIDPGSGVFTWCPSECQGPGVYTIPVYVVDYGNNEASDLAFVKITVNEVNQPPWMLAGGGTAYVGRTNYFTLCSGDADCPANPRTFSLLAPVPAGMTIDASSGVVRWVPTVAQVGSTNVKVRLCDGGAPNYCATNTLTVGVTTNAPYSLAIERLANGDLQFTILGGLTNVSYALQWTTDLCQCPCQPVWQNLGYISPTTMPYTFVIPSGSLGGAEKLFFRLDQVPRQ